MANFKYKSFDKVRIMPQTTKLNWGKVGIVTHREERPDGNYYNLYGYPELYAETALFPTSRKGKDKDKGNSDKQKAKDFSKRNTK